MLTGEVWRQGLPNSCADNTVSEAKRNKPLNSFFAEVTGAASVTPQHKRLCF
ncbi:hypothetical protein [Emticicia sp. 17c]|uniref:hypothetical protein n=1 Tax=Emticicia sp. 17c TaxID=3127704 RepID=UPI00301D86A9